MQPSFVFSPGSSLRLQASGQRRAGETLSVQRQSRESAGRAWALTAPVLGSSQTPQSLPLALVYKQPALNKPAPLLLTPRRGRLRRSGRRGRGRAGQGQGRQRVAEGGQGSGGPRAGVGLGEDLALVPRLQALSLLTQAPRLKPSRVPTACEMLHTVWRTFYITITGYSSESMLVFTRIFFHFT